MIYRIYRAEFPKYVRELKHECTNYTEANREYMRLQTMYPGNELMMEVENEYKERGVVHRGYLEPSKAKA